MKNYQKVFVQKMIFVTLPETIAPENGWLEDEDVSFWDSFLVGASG